MENILTISPFSFEPLSAFILSAKKSITIENQYLNDKRFNSAIVEAAKRGVKINITLASACSFGKPDFSTANKLSETFKKFDVNNISLKMMPSRFLVNNHNGYMHAKAIVVDNNIAWVGSVNGSISALSINREFGMFIYDLKQVTKLENFMLNTHNSNMLETWSESINCTYDK